MNRLMAFHEKRVIVAAKALKEVIDAGDDERWRALWPKLGALESSIRYVLGTLPDDFLGRGNEELVSLGPDRMPEPGSAESTEFLRFVAWRHALHSVEVIESAWHVAFPALVQEHPALALGKSEEYAALRELVFTQNSAPMELACLDQSPDYTTNWISLPSVRRLCQLENTEHLLQRVGDALRSQSVPLGADFLAIRRALEFADLAGWSLYLWSPGS